MRKIIVKNIGFICFVLLSVASGAGQSNAEMITLQDGRVLDGKVIENKDGSITIEVENPGKVLGKKKIDAKAGSGNVQAARTAVPPKSSRKVQLYMTSWCPYCIKMEQFLSSSKIPYMRMDIENDTAAQREYQERGGDGGIPWVIVDQTAIRGFDPRAVQEAWDEWNKE